MKPKYWSRLSADQKDFEIQKMDKARRDHLLRQALDTAIREMKKDPKAEQSNIEDMEMLLEGLGGPLS